MKNIFYALFAFTFILQNVTAATVTNGEEFYLNVAQEYVHELEEYGLCNFFLDDFQQNITRTNFYGYDVIGTVYYTNGFIGTMQKAETAETIYSPSPQNDFVHFKIDIILTSFIIYFDFYADITSGPFGGTVAIPLDKIEKELLVTIYYNTTVDYEVNVKSVSGIFLSKWSYEPSNHITEIINREIDSSYSFYDDFKTIAKTQWKELLGNVLDRVPLPEICQFC